MDKLEFLALYNIACMKALNANNIHQGFVTTDLVPYNSDQILLWFNIKVCTSSSAPIL